MSTSQSYPGAVTESSLHVSSDRRECSTSSPTGGLRARFPNAFLPRSLTRAPHSPPSPPLASASWAVHSRRLMGTSAIEWPKSMLIVSLSAWIDLCIGLLPLMSTSACSRRLLVSSGSFKEWPSEEWRRGSGRVEHAPEGNAPLRSFVQMGIPPSHPIQHRVSRSKRSSHPRASWRGMASPSCSAPARGIGLSIRLSLTETPQFRRALTARKLSQFRLYEVLRLLAQVLLARGTFIARTRWIHCHSVLLSYTPRILH